MTEERRIFEFEGKRHRLTLTELQGRLSGAPTKHVLAVWEKGIKSHESVEEWEDPGL